LPVSAGRLLVVGPRMKLAHWDNSRDLRLRSTYYLFPKQGGWIAG
jgi:hypothetical protein